MYYTYLLFKYNTNWVVVSTTIAIFKTNYKHTYINIVNILAFTSKFWILDFRCGVNDLIRNPHVMYTPDCYCHMFLIHLHSFSYIYCFDFLCQLSLCMPFCNFQQHQQFLIVAIVWYSRNSQNIYVILQTKTKF